MIEIAAAIVYYYGWRRLDARTHMLVGWIYFVAAWASLFVINGIITGEEQPPVQHLQEQQRRHLTLTRDQVRRAALEAAGFEATPWVAPQWGVIGIFTVLLVAALATVGWMLVVLARGKASA